MTDTATEKKPVVENTNGDNAGSQAVLKEINDRFKLEEETVPDPIPDPQSSEGDPDPTPKPDESGKPEEDPDPTPKPDEAEDKDGDPDPTPKPDEPAPTDLDAETPLDDLMSENQKEWWTGLPKELQNDIEEE